MRPPLRIAISRSASSRTSLARVVLLDTARRSVARVRLACSHSVQPQSRRWFGSCLAFHKAIRRLEADGPKASPHLEHLNLTEFNALMHVYRVSLTYVTSLLDFGKLSRSVENQVNHGLRLAGWEAVKAARVSADAAKEGSERLERSWTTSKARWRERIRGGPCHFHGGPRRRYRSLECHDILTACQNPWRSISRRLPAWGAAT